MAFLGGEEPCFIETIGRDGFIGRISTLFAKERDIAVGGQGHVRIGRWPGIDGFGRAPGSGFVGGGPDRNIHPAGGIIGAGKKDAVGGRALIRGAEPQQAGLAHRANEPRVVGENTHVSGTAVGGPVCGTVAGGRAVVVARTKIQPRTAAGGGRNQFDGQIFIRVDVVGGVLRGSQLPRCAVIVGIDHMIAINAVGELVVARHDQPPGLRAAFELDAVTGAGGIPAPIR